MVEMFDYTLAAVVFAFVNIVLLGILITIYAQNIRVIRSYFTVGMVFVAAMLLIQNIMIIGFWSTLYMESAEFMKTVDMISHYMFVINLVQTIGLGILVWITRR
jgi:hypothetical protein